MSGPEFKDKQWSVVHESVSGIIYLYCCFVKVAYIYLFIYVFIYLSVCVNVHTLLI